jgi:hypothetical protein
MSDAIRESLNRFEAACQMSFGGALVHRTLKLTEALSANRNIQIPSEEAKFLSTVQSIFGEAEGERIAGLIYAFLIADAAGHGGNAVAEFDSLMEALAETHPDSAGVIRAYGSNNRSEHADIAARFVTF